MDKRPANFIDMTGKRFGRWLVLDEAPKKAGSPDAQWHCRCDCGTERVVNGQRLRDHKTKSCGCLQKEISSAICKNRGKIYGNIWQNDESFDDVFANY